MCTCKNNLVLSSHGRIEMRNAAVLSRLGILFRRLFSRTQLLVVLLVYVVCVYYVCMFACVPCLYIRTANSTEYLPNRKARKQ